ncbi:hypothetical protein ABE607_16750 [Comamonas aquatica]|jgi:hypothetical protein|uniref:hypothetical protein n=1 Tax=Comamonas aquatica TaxID=225991 RepID=UPI0022DD63E4|nr:hypothetical protein [Comamonas aquatica]MDH1902185.1 hypothetical protein [Comamonas aquatica]WBM41637.1 hypothetical protein M2J84_16365 [Comamonas aquatica]
MTAFTVSGHWQLCVELTCRSWPPAGRKLLAVDSTGQRLHLTRAQASRVPRINNQISGGCLSEAPEARSEFRRISRLQGARFLSPISFGKTKEIGSPPVDYRPRKAIQKQKSKKVHPQKRLETTHMVSSL